MYDLDLSNYKKKLRNYRILFILSIFLSIGMVIITILSPKDITNYIVLLSITAITFVIYFVYIKNIKRRMASYYDLATKGKLFKNLQYKVIEYGDKRRLSISCDVTGEGVKEYISEYKYDALEDIIKIAGADLLIDPKDRNRYFVDFNIQEIKEQKN